MDIHKPKAAHSWREFLTEIGTIVCGILIALGLEQVAEAVHWGHKIHEAEHAMKLELVEDDGPQAWARVAAAPCFDQRLDALAQMAEDQADRRAFRKAALAYHPPDRSWDQQSWQATVASDVGTHMGAEQLVRWSSPYRSMSKLDQTASEELENRTALRALADRPGPLSEAEADRAIGVIVKLRQENDGMAGMSLTLIQAMKEAGIEVSEADRRDIFGQASAALGACARDPATTLAARGQLSDVVRNQFNGYDRARVALGLTPLK